MTHNQKQIKSLKKAKSIVRQLTVDCIRRYATRGGMAIFPYREEGQVDFLITNRVCQAVGIDEWSCRSRKAALESIDREIELYHSLIDDPDNEGNQ